MAKRYILLFLLGTVIGLGVLFALQRFLAPKGVTLGPAEMRAGPTITGPQIGGPFTLTTHRGETVTDETFRGKFMLIFFGFTHCPDVCPTELAKFAQVLQVLGPAANTVQPLFITIDPERDTAEALARHISLFDERILGLTGTPEQIAAVTKNYRVYYAKAPSESAGDYLMDHSSFAYLMAPDGSFIDVFPLEKQAADIAFTIRRVTSMDSEATKQQSEKAR
jgi:protein SCO1/2